MNSSQPNFEERLTWLWKQEFDNDSIYRRFPRACCGDTSDLLAQYLLDKGIKTDYVCGTYWGKPDGNGQLTHG